MARGGRDVWRADGQAVSDGGEFAREGGDEVGGGVGSERGEEEFEVGVEGSVWCVLAVVLAEVVQ